MARKNYGVLVRVLILCGAILSSIGMLLKDHTAKMVCLGIAAALFFSAAVQLVLYKIRPQLFDDKKLGKREN